MPLLDNAWYVRGSSGVAVTDLGSINSSAGATMTLAITVPAGALIIVTVCEQTSAAAGTLADATNGAYTLAASGAMSAAAGFGMVFFFQNSAALNAITLTYTKQTSGRATSMTAFYATGMATASAHDAAFANTSAVNSASPTVTSAAAPAANGELIIGSIAFTSAAGRVVTNTGSFVTPFATNGNTPGAQVGGGHINVGGSLSYTYNPTIAAAVDNVTMITAFKPATSTLIGWWNVAKWAPSTTYVAGTLVRQNGTPVINSERVFVVTNSPSGTGQSGATEPVWVVTRGGKTTDNVVIWVECTGIAALNGDLANTPTWNSVKNTTILVGQVIKSNAGDKILICHLSGTAGNGAEPSWAAYTTTGAQTVDNTVTWVTLAAVPSGYASWSAPHARMLNAYGTSWLQTANSVFAADDHSEVQPTALNLNTGIAGPVQAYVYCVDRTAALPPGQSDLRTTAVIATSGSGGLSIQSSNSNTGQTYYNGFQFIVGSGANTASIIAGGANNAHSLWFDNCAFVLGNSSSSSQIVWGISNEWGGQRFFNNVTVSFGNVGQTIAPTGVIDQRWRNTPNAVQGSIIPTNLITLLQGTARALQIVGVDLSAVGSGKTLVNPTSGSAGGMVLLDSCKLNASVTVSSTPGGHGIFVDLVRCDSGTATHRTERYQFQGTLTTETSIVRTGGATDGTTPISWKIVATANARWISPFQTVRIPVWVDTTGSHTVTVYGTTTGGGVPNNDDIFIEAEYESDASSTMASFATTTKASPLAASVATNNSADASTWGGAGAGNGFKMVTPAFTVNQRGYVYVVVSVAKASATYYVDPGVVVI